VAQETRENLRPELNLQGQASTNGRDTELAPSISDSADPHHPTLGVALNFRMDLDPTGKGRVVQAANIDAEASKLKAERLKFESQSAWRELMRRHQELGRRIEAARDLVKVQDEKYKRERDRLERGRTTTFQVVTFEQDAAEAESTLLQLMTEQRKLEAQARLFVPMNRAEKL
jgi:outer membrane protein TolC